MKTPELTRRTFSTALLGAATIAGLPKAAFAAEIATLKIGATTVSMLSDGHFEIPSAFFQGANGAAMALAGDPIDIGATVWLVRDGERTILVDTGSGAALSEMFPTVGKLDALLAAEGIEKDTITDIILTHMHADHIGGLMGPDAGGFRNATIHVAEAEWTFWTNPDLPAAAPDADKPMIDLLQSIAGPLADRIKTYASEADLGGGITLVPLVGHTPGHSGVRILADNGEELFIVGDAIISEALQFANPTVRYALDSDPEQAIATRTELLGQLADDQTIFSATHLSYPGTGRVTRSGDGFVFVPLT
ncbi:MBL fold metallo-hydrolase [Ruegeria arenilitoris]|uniref:MBL fold metallo-hydrolase n=1 Tax=Ruegeria arenilitoris TaxID=1173585 RepID=UPI00147D0912|nr:MBL fold metallo-hydrolase [Ruegeria arenilitoris]